MFFHINFFCVLKKTCIDDIKFNLFTQAKNIENKLRKLLDEIIGIKTWELYKLFCYLFHAIFVQFLYSGYMFAVICKNKIIGIKKEIWPFIRKKR